MLISAGFGLLPLAWPSQQCWVFPRVAVDWRAFGTSVTFVDEVGDPKISIQLGKEENLREALGMLPEIPGLNTDVKPERFEGLPVGRP